MKSDYDVDDMVEYAKRSLRNIQARDRDLIVNRFKHRLIACSVTGWLIVLAYILMLISTQSLCPKDITVAVMFLVYLFTVVIIGVVSGTNPIVYYGNIIDEQDIKKHKTQLFVLQTLNVVAITALVILGIKMWEAIIGR